MIKLLHHCLLAVLALFLAGSSFAVAQEAGSPAPDNRFLLSGYGFTTYTDPGGEDGVESFNVSFVPIFLFQVSDRFLFEAEVEFEFEDEAVETAVEYAQIDWIANDYLTVVGGKYLTPFGSFIEKLHPAWINKLPTFPLPYQHGQSLVPFGQTGAQLRGGVPFGDGNRRFTYSLFVSNGFRQSQHGEEPGHDEGPETEEPEHDDDEVSARNARLSPSSGGDDGDGHGEDDELIFMDGSSFNSNGEMALGGRFAVFPARGFEFGLSYLSGNYDETGGLSASMAGIDFTYHHDLFDVRAEWLDTTTERGLAEDRDPLRDQEVQSWYIQPSLRLSVIPVYAFNKMELVARRANLDYGNGDRDQTSVGLNYYFTGSSVLRFAWERLEETGLESENTVNVMFALGF